MTSASSQRVPTTIPNENARPVVRPFQSSMTERWDSFVARNPRASFFHQVGWKRLIEKTFGYEPCYFYAEQAGRITGIAPFFWISNWAVGRCLLSIPFAVYGGICADDAESEQMLLGHLKQLALSEQVDFLELRNRNGGLLPGFHPNQRYATFTGPLLPTSEENRKRLPKDTRYMIRKAERAGLSLQRGLHLMSDFYRLFSLSMRHHGTPVFPRALFDNLVEEFPGKVDLFMAFAASQPVAGVVSFFFRETILPYYAGASPQARGCTANTFLYWRLMNIAAQEGFRCFDFGRSKKGTGSFTFKTQWNMNVESLDYQVHLVRRKKVPDFSPLNPKIEMAARAWKRLPLWLTVRMGPRVVRWFP